MTVYAWAAFRDDCRPPAAPAADCFAIGVMVVEALTGRNPFRKDDPRETVSAILNDRAGIDGEDPGRQALDRVLQRCLAKAREQRFATARELQEALIPALASCPASGPSSLTTLRPDTRNQSTKVVRE